MNQYDGLAWYHQWHLAPEAALTEWNFHTEQLRREMRMTEHYEVLQWFSQIQQKAGAVEPLFWARALLHRGTELWNSSQGDRAENLHQAIQCFEQALTVYTRQDFPHDWAATLNNKGNALSDLPDGDRAANLRHAIQCFEQALTVYTRQDFPQDWAATLNNKGNALSDLPDGDRAENLRHAIQCFEQALTVRTRHNFPHDWAATLNNKGYALQNLPDGDRSANLRQAIQCYEQALTVRTFKDFPQQWAETQLNLCIAYYQSGLREKAREYIDSAIEGFRVVGHQYYLERAEGLKTHIQNEEDANGTS